MVGMSSESPDNDPSCDAEQQWGPAGRQQSSWAGNRRDAMANVAALQPVGRMGTRVHAKRKLACVFHGDWGILTANYARTSRPCRRQGEQDRSDTGIPGLRDCVWQGRVEITQAAGMPERMGLAGRAGVVAKYPLASYMARYERILPEIVEGGRSEGGCEAI